MRWRYWALSFGLHALFGGVWMLLALDPFASVLPETEIDPAACVSLRLVSPGSPDCPPKAAAAPGEVLIPPVRATPESERPRNADPELEAFAKNGGVVKPEAADNLRHGAEARFGAALFGYDKFSAKDYIGEYAMGRDTVAIIDARATPVGRLVLYDSATGLKRKLREFGRYIYTYGPSFDQDEPIEGTLVFLAKDDEIWRFIWMPAKGGSARFPIKNALAANRDGAKADTPH